MSFAEYCIRDKTGVFPVGVFRFDRAGNRRCVVDEIPAVWRDVASYFGPDGELKSKAKGLDMVLPEIKGEVVAYREEDGETTDRVSGQKRAYVSRTLELFVREPAFGVAVVRFFDDPFPGKQGETWAIGVSSFAIKGGAAVAGAKAINCRKVK